MVNLAQALNNVQDTLAVDYTAGGGTLTLSTGQGAKYSIATSTAPIMVRIGSEYFAVTGQVGSTDVINVTGAQESSLASNHGAGSVVEVVLTAATWQTARLLLLAGWGYTRVDQLATGGAGTSGSPWTGWETAFNALPVGGKIVVTPGYYTQTVSIAAKAGWLIEGGGQDVTFIRTTADIEQITWLTTNNGGTVGTPAYAMFTLRDLTLESTHATPTKAGVYLMCGVSCAVERVTVKGNRWGIALDGAEVSTIAECRLEQQKNSGAGVMLANGNEYWASRTGGAMAEFVTNRNTIRDCQFNQSDATCSGICDDGGISLHISGCNFNGGLYGIVAYARDTLIIDGACEFEGQASTPIRFANTKFDGTTVGTVTQGACLTVSLLGNYILPTQSAGASISPAIAAANIVGTETVNGFVVMGNTFIVTSPYNVVLGGAEFTGVVWLGNFNPGSATAVWDANPVGRNNLYLGQINSATVNNLGLGNGFTSAAYGSGHGALFLPAATAAPTAAPVGGALLVADPSTSVPTVWTPSGGTTASHGLVPLGASTTFTPTIAQSGALTFTTLYARYILLGKIAHIWLGVHFTNGGTTNNPITVTLPSPLNNMRTLSTPAGGGAMGGFKFYDSGTAEYVGIPAVTGAATVIFVRDGSNNGGLGTFPNFAVQNGDELTMWLTVELS